MHIRELEDPDGNLVYNAEEWFSPADEQKTNAAFLAAVSNLNWPVAADDPPLREGRWRALIGMTDSEGSFIKGDVDVDILFKSDADATAGTVRVALVHSVDEDPGLKVAIDQAKGLWTDLYASIGLTLEIEDWQTTDEGLAPPTAGDPRYAEIAEATGLRTIVVALTDEIDTSQLNIDSLVGQIVGISGGIPGALTPSPRSAVQVSTLAAVGTDGIISEAEIRLLAETLAHETAHYLGLFHPVEALVGGMPWSVFDALTDTPRCGGQTRCINLLGNNLMFPFPVCDFDGTCEPQEQFSGEQIEVLQRYTGVD
ncbi:MAG: hypothetical protein AAGA48_40815 [Myxococcota bacterium]